MSGGGSCVRFWVVGILAVTTSVVGPTAGLGADRDGPVVNSIAELVRLSRSELEGLYRAADGPPPAPAGAVRGRAIFSPGSRATVPASRLTWLLWQGKAFRPDGTMANRVLGLRAVTARVFPAESWLDGRPTLVMDYAGTSRLFGHVRDEVREVAPGLYLGIAYLRREAGPELGMFFALDAR